MRLRKKRPFFAFDNEILHTLWVTPSSSRTIHVTQKHSRGDRYVTARPKPDSGLQRWGGKNDNQSHRAVNSKRKKTASFFALFLFLPPTSHFFFFFFFSKRSFVEATKRLLLRTSFALQESRNEGSHIFRKSRFVLVSVARPNNFLYLPRPYFTPSHFVDCKIFVRERVATHVVQLVVILVLCEGWMAYLGATDNDPDFGDRPRPWRGLNTRYLIFLPSDQTWIFLLTQIDVLHLFRTIYRRGLNPLYRLRIIAIDYYVNSDWVYLNFQYSGQKASGGFRLELLRKYQIWILTLIARRIQIKIDSFVSENNKMFRFATFCFQEKFPA